MNILFIIVALLMPVASFAAPSVSSVSGTFSHGNTITINSTGSNFGTKSPAAPLRWETWESLNVGDTPADTGWWTEDASTAVASTANQRHSRSTKSMFANITRIAAKKWHKSIPSFATTKKLIVNYWTRFTYGDDPGGAVTQWQIKTMRLHAGSGSTITYPSIAFYNWYYPDQVPPKPRLNITNNYFGGSSGPGQAHDFVKTVNNAWYNEEIIINQGTIGTADGYLETNISYPNYSGYSRKTTNSMIVDSGNYMDTLYFENYSGNGSPDPIPIYYDDIYVDDTWARVVVGNASSYYSCTHREMLIPVTWSASTIMATFNQGAFQNGQPVYLFVVDSTGAVSPGKLITISGTYVDATPPYASNYSPAKSSTGVLETNRTISFTLNDATDVLTANGIVNIEGTNFTCASGLTCNGNGTPTATVSRTMGSDWSAGQVVNVSISGFRDSLGNIMTTDTYSYTIRSAPATLNINTTTLPNGTVGTAYSQALSISGGTSPYTCSTPLGAWPTGITLAPNCIGWSGTPTISGTFVANAKVTDALSATDNQDLQIIVAQTPVAGGASDSSDTYVNINSGGNDNYADNTYLEVYTYPVNTVANFILDNLALPALPANATITSATLRLYVIGTDGAGGDSLMRLYASPVIGMPSINLVTWNSFVDNAATLGASESYADVPKDNTWISWNVTNMAQAAKAAGTNILLSIDGSVAVSGGTSAADTSRKFASNQHATVEIRPQLVVVYTTHVDTAPSSPTISAPGKMRISRGRFQRFQ